MKVAALPLNATAVAPTKLVPLIVIEVPTTPLLGLKLVIVGAATTVKLVALVAVPPAVVTVTGPLLAPAGTVAVIIVAELTVKVAALPLNATAVAPLKLVPVTVTDIPTPPLAGLNVVIVGAATTVKLLELVAVPPAVVTVTGPLLAPAGTVAVI